MPSRKGTPMSIGERGVIREQLVALAFQDESARIRSFDLVGLHAEDLDTADCQREIMIN